MSSETALSKQIRDALELVGCWVLRLNSGRVRGGKIRLCKAGTPDILVLWPTVAFLEVKRPGEKLNKSQVDWHRRARSAGLEVHTVESVHAVALLAQDWFARRRDRAWEAVTGLKAGG